MFLVGTPVFNTGEGEHLVLEGSIPFRLRIACSSWLWSSGRSCWTPRTHGAPRSSGGSCWARAFINELERVTDDVVLLVDEQIAEQVTKLSALGTAGTRHLIIGNVDVPGDLVLQSGEGRICRRP